MTNKKRLLIFLLIAFLSLYNLANARASEPTQSTSLSKQSSVDFGGYRPHYQGYGVNTPGGRGGQVIKVTNLNNAGPGSLLAALEASGPRIVVCEVSGTVELPWSISVTNPFLTLALQTCPSPGLTVKATGKEFRIETHDVVIQHLRLRGGDHGGDGVNLLPIGNNAYNIVLDHVSISWATSKCLASDLGTQDVAVLDSIISECLAGEGQPATGYVGLGHLVTGTENGTLTVARTMYAHNGNRNPIMGAGLRAVFYNNVIYDWFGDVAQGENTVNWGAFMFTGTPACCGTPAPLTEIVAKGNIFVAGPNTPAASKPIKVSYTKEQHNQGVQIYLDDNSGHNCPIADQWDCVNFLTAFSSVSNRANSEITSPPSWYTNFNFNVLPNANMKAHVLANAGARPLDRDAVDTRVVADVTQRDGDIINSESEVGGFPALAQNTRILTIPANPNAIAPGQTFRTNIEIWLEDYAKALEPATAFTPTPTPTPTPPTPTSKAVIYDNDGGVESGYTDEFVYALASAGAIDLKGIITTISYAEENRNPPYSPLTEQEIVMERQELIEKARRSGLKNLPDVTAGPSLSLDTRRPSSGRIEDTKPFGSKGGWLIVNEARKATAQQPLVIIMGGQATAVADAYLLDNSIADKIILQWIVGHKAGNDLSYYEYNYGVDPWATYIAFERLRVKALPYFNDGNDMNDGLAQTPKSRLTELPDTEMRQLMMEAMWYYNYAGCLLPDADYDAAGAIDILRSDYVTETRRFSFSHWDPNPWGKNFQIPVYKPDTNGNLLVGWTLDGTVATDEWWKRMKDSAAWSTPAGQVPFGGTAKAVPGIIEAEHFDHGGTGRAYFDDSNNFCNSYLNPIRSIEHVDIYASGTASNGFKVGSTKAGEWVEYTISVATAGMYTLETRVASNGAGGKYHVEFNGIDKTGSLIVPNTGGWDSWQIVSKTGISLNAGTYVMRLAMDSNGMTGYVGDFDSLTLKSESPSVIDFGAYRPHYQGYGVNTPGGRGGIVNKVTNLNDDGPGSFREAVAARPGCDGTATKCARFVVFEVSGTIALSSILSINSPYITIAGQTAPSPGINTRDFAFYVDTHDVVLQHFRVRTGDARYGDGPKAYAFGISDPNNQGIPVGSVYNVVLDHMSISWGAGATTLGVSYGVKDVSLLDSIVSEGLYHNAGPNWDWQGGIGNIWYAYPDGTATVARNAFIHNGNRNPWISAGYQASVYNNLAYNPHGAATDPGTWGFLQVIGLRPHYGISKVELVNVGNVYVAGPDTHKDVKPVKIWMGPEYAATGNQIYLADNIDPINKYRPTSYFASGQWNGVTYIDAATEANSKITSIPSWHTAFSYNIMPSSQVQNYVLANAGARPKDRDAVDKRILEDVTQLDGTVWVNSQNDVGGHPNLAVNTRTLTIPANPNAIAPGQTFRTNIEIWLEDYAKALEPATAFTPTPTPTPTPPTPTPTPLIAGDYGGYRPHYQGYGVNTPGGRGGVVIRVTNLNNSGSGSLRNAMVPATCQPRFVIFEVSGYITLTSPIEVTCPFLTVAGQTAPSPGITVRGSAIRIDTHDVVLQHFAIRPGDLSFGLVGLYLRNNAPRNIVIDHMSVGWTTDTIFGSNAWAGGPSAQDYTIIDSIFSESLLKGCCDPYTNAAPAGMLLYPNPDGTATLGRNLFAHNGNRNPWIGQGYRLSEYNNVRYNARWNDNPGVLGFVNIPVCAYESFVAWPFEVVSIGNIAIPGPDTTSGARQYRICIDSERVGLGHQLYLADNTGPNQTLSNQWGGVFFGNVSGSRINAATESDIRINTIPSWHSAFNYQILPNANVQTHVLANVGARPLNRDAVDSRVISNVQNGTGQIITSPNDVGGYPTLAQNTRTLTIPANPNAIAPGQTFRTNIEMWLEDYARGLEVTTPIPAPTPTPPPTPTPTPSINIKPTTNPSAHYGFNESSGTTALDSSEFNNHATLFNGASFAPGPFGDNALSLDGINDIARVSQTSGLNFNQALTITAIVRPHALSSTAYNTVVVKGNQTSRGYGMNIYQGKLNFVKVGANNVRSTVPITPRIWQRLTITYNQTTGATQFWMNGNLTQTVTDTSPMIAPIDSDPLLIGSWLTGDQSFFQGQIEDLRVYSKVLSSSEIQALPMPNDAAIIEAPVLGKGAGLKAEYFDDVNLSGLKIIRVDPFIDFDWGTGSVFDSDPGSPDPSIGLDTFSARWTGQIQPLYSEIYTFYTLSDDGIRLWVNDQLLIDDWNDHLPFENKGTIQLAANKLYSIKIEYYENSGSSSAKLMWFSSSQPKEVVPKSQLYPQAINSSVVSLEKCGLVSCHDPACRDHLLCKTDSDDDGIFDADDLCPSTKSIYKNSVNNRGCPMPISTKFTSGLTTNFSDTDLNNLKNFKIGIEGLGVIDYGNNAVSLVENMSNSYEQIDLDELIEFLPRRVIVKSDLFRGLNHSAIVTLVNISGITNPIIMKDNTSCDICTILSFNNGNLTFKVQHWTEYSVDEGSYCGDSFCSTQESCSSCSNDCGTCPGSGSSGGGSSGGGSGGGGGGGGGGAIGFVCNKNWQCSDWSDCINGIQSRDCSFVQVQQFYQNAECPASSNWPVLRQDCEDGGMIAEEEAIFTEQPKGKAKDISSELGIEEQQHISSELGIEEQQQIETSVQKSKIKAFIVVFTSFMLLILLGISIYEFKVHLGPRNSAANTITEGELIAVRSYVYRVRAVGRSDAYIKDSLVRTGWPKDVIDRIFRNI